MYLKDRYSAGILQGNLKLHRKSSNAVPEELIWAADGIKQPAFGEKDRQMLLFLTILFLVVFGLSIHICECQVYRSLFYCRC